MKWLLFGALFTVGCASQDDVVIASAQSPTSLATDGTWVVWTNRTGEVMRVSTAGGAAERIALADAPTNVAIASGDVFFTAKDGVWKNDTLVAPAEGAWSVAANASRVFWTTNTIAGPVMTCPLGGACTPAQLAGGDASFAIAIDETNVYWSDWNAIWTCPIGGCTSEPTPLAAVAGHVALAVDASRIYWAMSDVILACDKHACIEPVIVATHQTSAPENAIALASDGAHLYWLAATALVRDGEIIATLDSPGVALAVDGENVWVATSDRVVKIAKN
ncbi:MAG TPA: hypothetical protein VGH87_00730 [Polyangiaceae bacterium]|jgi:hypothetical protein|nr:hypothetical protein [Polyangiaceae bacterium]